MCNINMLFNLKGGYFMLKRFFVFSLIALFVFGMAACGKTGAEGKYEDGLYYAENEAYSKDWKYFVKIEVKDGKIASVDWNGVNLNGGKDKDTLSAEGGYPMVEKGDAQAPWHEQADLVEEYLIETQDPEKVAFTDEDGHTDDIAGVTIKVKDFFDLAKKALENGPVAKGDYKDGIYYAQEKEFTKGFKNFAHIAVVNGTIVAVDFNAIVEEGDVLDKDNLSRSGAYGLVEKGGAQAEWHEQVAKAEAHLIKTQDPEKISYTDDEGHTDDIAGVSIHVKEFFDLAKQALAEAK